jgi:hypothetical protein
MRMIMLLVLISTLCVCVVPGAAQPQSIPDLPPIQPPMIPPGDILKDIDKSTQERIFGHKPHEHSSSPPPAWLRWEYAGAIFGLALLGGLIKGLTCGRT